MQRGRHGLQKTERVPRVFGSQLPVVVGCGVRLGYPCLPPRELRVHAQCQSGQRIRAATKLFLGALHTECHDNCPALGMHARMRSATCALVGDRATAHAAKT